MSSQRADLLQRSPEEAARRIALACLAEAHAASRRLDDREDAEALHDFRVAIRRLRSTLRAWKGPLSASISRKHRRSLRRLQEATGAGRDAEVALEWLAEQRQTLHPSHRRGHDWLADELSGRHGAAMEHASEKLRHDFDELEGKLERRLERMEIHLLQPVDRERFAGALADQTRAALQRITALLGEIESAEDQRICHEARIAVKRLRYLVEPARGEASSTKAVVARCKALQDVLGDLNDAHVLREELGAALESAVAEQARRLHALARDLDETAFRRESRRTPRPGLLELTRRVQARMAALFSELQMTWLVDDVGGLVAEVDAFCDELERSATAGLEIERKYLLRRLPEIPQGAEVLEVAQGWLPGKRIRERIRRVRSTAGTKYVRTLKFGLGVTRGEVEEPTTLDVFLPLWELTKDCRVRKRRYRVREGDLVWEIDEFLDRELFLAEVELPNAELRPAFPDWLEGFVERDVTDDKRYTNLQLAKSGERAPSDD